MSKRRLPIDPQGHLEEVRRVPPHVECKACRDVRLLINDWRRRCPAEVVQPAPATPQRREVRP